MRIDNILSRFLQAEKTDPTYLRDIILNFVIAGRDTIAARNEEKIFQDAKICFSDDILPDGFSVRKGDMVSYQPYAMGRMKFIWGDDAEEFRPERWFDRDGKLQPQIPFKFTAFQTTTAAQRMKLLKNFCNLE
ncbi:Cytochrome P450 704C1, partial [Cucurbita argyrosperma subsp. sororia]